MFYGYKPYGSGLTANLKLKKGTADKKKKKQTKPSDGMPALTYAFFSMIHT